MIKNFEITFCEVGARGKVRDFSWLERYVDYVGFEPDQAAFNSKNTYLIQRNFRSINLFPDAVGTSDTIQSKRLFITEHPGCSSIFNPNFKVIDEFNGYKINDETRQFNQSFKIKNSVSVRSRSLNEFLKSTPFECFDIIQIDTQGGEIEILESLNSIDRVICIDIELEFLELYEGQSLFMESFNSLTDKGFILARVFNQQYAPSLVLDRFNQVDKGILFSTDCIFLRLPKKGKEFTKENIEMTKKFIAIAYSYGFYSLAVKYCNLGLRSKDCPEDYIFFDFMRDKILKEYKTRNFFPKIKRVINKFFIRLIRKVYSMLTTK